MGMSSVLGAALSGLRASQAGLELVSRNVANADLPGYTKKTVAPTPLLAGGNVIGVKLGDINRQLDTFVLRQMWRESSGAGYVNTLSRYFTHVDTMLGAPGSPAGLDSLYNTFLGSLEALTASPESFTVRDKALRDAQALAQTLNQTSHDIQSLRQEAERGIADAVKRINELLNQIGGLNRDIASRGSAGLPPADLLDLRDARISELSKLIDLKVVERGSGEVALFTQSGTLLLDLTPGELIFDERGGMSPQALYAKDDAARGVGTVRLASPNGMVIDLIEDRAIRSGELAALIELRDKHLVQAQAQLDAFADGLARALSTNRVAGTAASDGGLEGFEIDLAPLLSGDRFSVRHSVGGVEEEVTFVRVDDPTTLPLPPGAVPGAPGRVVGIDYSAGWAGVVAQISAELGPGITVQDLGGGQIRILGGGNPGDPSIASVSAEITAGGFHDGLGLPLFIDGAGNAPYSASLDGKPQQLGFAGRIKVNPALLADNSLLVKYASGVAIGDSARPFDLLERLTQQQRHFAAEHGVSGTTGYSGTVGGFLQRVISFQASQQADAARAKQAQDVVVAQLEERFTRESGVDVDEEMARLIELQTAFQANTRVVQAYREMMAMLMQL